MTRLERDSDGSLEFQAGHYLIRKQSIADFVIEHEIIPFPFLCEESVSLFLCRYLGTRKEVQDNSSHNVMLASVIAWINTLLFLDYRLDYFLQQKAKKKKKVQFLLKKKGLGQRQEDPFPGINRLSMFHFSVDDTSSCHFMI